MSLKFSIILLGVFCRSYAVGQENKSVVNFPDVYGNLFISVGYPKLGDVPLLNRKIFKGMRVTVQEHPYIVSVRRQFSHYLAGTILTKKMVITVAQPIYQLPIYELGIVAGETYSDRGTMCRSVVLVIVHEDFNPYTLEADLAILRIYEEFDYKVSVKAIPLISPMATLNDERVFVTGWGRCDMTGKELCLPRSTRFAPDEKIDPMLRTISFVVASPNYYCEGYHRATPQAMHTLFLPALNVGRCYFPERAQSYRFNESCMKDVIFYHLQALVASCDTPGPWRHTSQHETRLQPGMLCVGIAREENPVAPCLAVPGAALVANARIVGLQSWGFGCGYQNDLPLVYTDLRHYQPWILHNMPILRNLTQENFTGIFQVMKAYTLTKWLSLTRGEGSQRIALKGPIKSLNYNSLDIELSKLKGNIFDIRDCIYSGEIQKLKKDMFQNIRIEYEHNQPNVSTWPLKKITPYPFLDKNRLVQSEEFNNDPSDEYDDFNDTYETNVEKIERLDEGYDADNAYEFPIHI